MHIFTNLPRTLRILFSVLRITTVLLAAMWLFSLTFGGWIQRRFADEPKLKVTFGEISLKTPSSTVDLQTKGSTAGSLSLVAMRGTLQADLLSNDAALTSALRRTLIPAMIVSVGFAWLLFSALRSLCANIEQGDVFCDANLILVRRVGLILIGYSLAGVLAQLWGSYVMNGYLQANVLLSSSTWLQFPSSAGALQFRAAAGDFPSGIGVIVGCLVLVIGEAFRQGLTLKTENDLTV